MYAIFQSGGHQYRAEEGEIIEVERLAVEDGAAVDFEDVLFVGGESAAVGRPTVAGAKVTGTVLGETKGRKVIVQKYKPKQRYKIKQGHRQRYTRVRIDAITAPERHGSDTNNGDTGQAGEEIENGA